MSFIRPEVLQAAAQWREALIGGVVFALGAYLAGTSFGVMFLIGLALVAGGAGLAYAGIQRARFRRGGSGPGIVQVVEGRVTYFGPFDGGSVALDRLEWLELDTAADGSRLWVLIEEDGQRLEIPVDARGSEALFDMFLALPGLGTERMLSMMKTPVRQRTLVWQREKRRLH